MTRVAQASHEGTREALAKLVARTMAWQVTVQDGTVWVSDTVNTVEITPKLLKARDERDAY